MQGGGGSLFAVGDVIVNVLNDLVSLQHLGNQVETVVVVAVALADGVIKVLILCGNVLAGDGSRKGELAAGDGVDCTGSLGSALHGVSRGCGGAAVVPGVVFEPLRCADGYLSAVTAGKGELVADARCGEIGVTEVDIIAAVIRGKLQFHGLPRVQ